MDIVAFYIAHPLLFYVFFTYSKLHRGDRPGHRRNFHAPANIIQIPPAFREHPFIVRYSAAHRRYGVAFARMTQLATLS